MPSNKIDVSDLNSPGMEGADAPLPPPTQPPSRAACPTAHALFCYDEDLLAPAERRQIRLHLVGCAACQPELREIHDAPDELAALAASPLSRLREVWAWVKDAVGEVQLALPTLEPATAAPLTRAGADPRRGPDPTQARYRAGDVLIDLRFTRDPDVDLWDVDVLMHPAGAGTLRLMRGGELLEQSPLASAASLRELDPGSYTLDLDLGGRHVALVLPPLP